MNCKWNENPCLLTGLLLELIYLCTDYLAPVERALGTLGAFISGLWLGAAILLMLVGLIRLSPQGRKRIAKLCFWKKG